MKNGMTIIICTYNGAERLSQTIAHIAAQIVPTSIQWELILADNASSDDTIEMTKLAWEKHNLSHIPLRVISEDVPGKLYALQKAIREASNEYLIICDDDNWLATDYFEKAYNILDTMPEVGAAGGLGIPVTDDAGFPEWFKDYHYAYAVGPQAEKTGVLKPRAILWGAGLATRRSLYLAMYKDYQSFLVESETNVLSAEDTEYCLRLILKGYKLYYDDTLVYWHYIPSFKLTTDFRDQKLIKGFQNSDIILRKYYAAMRARLKTRGRPDIWFALLLIAPFNYLFAFSAKRAEKARNTLFHLLPFNIPTDDISRRIKAFIRD
ncbi:glycosyltransferase [Pedobacter antarcticus]|uniref:glycosyltransferase n=1 Tax=Pedobacter antarcticus TaxID=34086 RepID=UPI002931E850|nr:glycosyltransferase [Pedobacter antarcticus]